MSFEFIIPALVFISVMALGGAVITARVARREPLQARLRGPALIAPDSRRGRKRLGQALESVGEMAAPSGPTPRLREELARAGYHSRNAALIYIGAKVFLLLIGLAVLAPLVMPLDLRLAARLGIIGCGATFLFFLPNMLVSMRRQKRSLEVRHHLPDALDLLEICVSSGMGLDMAWNAVSEEIRRVSIILSDEMALANLQIHLGASRAVAMRQMAARTGADELSSLVAILVQSERFGTSVADALKTFAKSMREQRSQRAEESAEKMAVKLLFPMVLFIFPAILIVAVGPSGIQLARVMFGR